MPRYNAKDAGNELPTGEYTLTIDKVENKVSKSTDEEMQRVTFTCHGQDRKVTVWEYFTFGRGLFRYRSLALGLGRYDDFKAETFDVADYVGQNVKATLFYDDKFDTMKVSDFVKREGAPAEKAGVVAQAPVAASGDRPTIEDDDIPF